MASRYKTRHGIDYWPAEMADLNIDLVYGKKWRELARRGHEVRDPWVPYLSALKTLYGDAFKVSPWTEDHVRNWVMNEKPVYWGPASCGKAVLLDEPVFFPDRVGTMREVEAGSVIMAATGGRVRVTGVYDQLDEPLYRVKFADGTETVCAGSHLWTVDYWGRVRWEGPRGSRHARNGWVTRTLTAERLALWKPSSLRRKCVSVPLTAPVEFDSRPVPLDPYVLGCLLGDGSLRGTVMLSSAEADGDVRDEFERRLPAGYALKRVSGGTNYMVVKSDGSKTRNVVNAALDGLGVRSCAAEDKFVPAAYKLNSVSVRTNLLAGLMDTDGCVERCGRVTFTSVSRTLADDVAFLVESLGGYVTRYEKIPTYKVRGARRLGRTAYTVCLHGLELSTLRRLFRLRRKLNRLREPAVKHVGRKHVWSVERISDRLALPRETRCITVAPFDEDGRPTNGLFPIGHFTVTHNSNDVAACLVPDWFVDPYSTITLVGSTTKDALRIRVWEAIERYFAVAKRYAEENGLLLPGKITQTGYAVLNDRQQDADPNAQGGKAGIHGVALNEGGKLQGAHLPYVRIVIDELATINDHQAIIDTISNLVVAEDFKFVAMANPEPWSTPSSSIYCTPVDGISSVSVDTREWDSTFGAHVLHDDGEKSPCVLDPSLEAEFPFLTRRKHLAEALRVGGGNPNAPSYWKMARGFPTPVAVGAPPVLDPSVAANMKVQEPGPPYSPLDVVAAAAGVDPSWTEGGDKACYARCWVRRDALGRYYLDFTNGLRRLAIDATDKAHPPVEQMRNQVLAIVRSGPHEAPLSNTAVDASGNQGLADDLLIYAGANCLAVNFSTRASDSVMRPGTKDPRVIKDYIFDRGTEAWCVLAEFCKAGMVRGLPPAAVRALTTRRFALRVDRKTGIVLGQVNPLRLEDKATFAKSAGGGFHASPDEADACALAALAVKERVGLFPFGYLVVAQTPVTDASPPPPPPPSEDYDLEFDDGPGPVDDFPV